MSATLEHPPAAWQRPLLWIILSLSFVLVLSSLTGSGHGLFGWGLMAGAMWMWMLLPALLVSLLVLFFLDLREERS